MNSLGMIVMMAVVGAIIGSFTNHIAIIMLFRPHEAKYIGKFQLPFTPGLIPKRRDELAAQLGKTVNDYLLTPETFRKKLFTPVAKSKLSTLLSEQADTHLFSSDRTIKEWLAVMNSEQLVAQSETKIAQWIDEKGAEFQAYLMAHTLEEVMPAGLTEDLNHRVNDFPSYLLNRADLYLRSDAAQAMFRSLLNNFLQSRGSMGNMLMMMFGDSQSIVEKIQKESLKFVRADATKQLVHELVQKEWVSLKNKEMTTLLEGVDIDKHTEDLKQFILRKLNLEERIDHPLSFYLPEGKAWFDSKVVPPLTSVLFKQAELKLDGALQSLKIDQMVEQQINEFPIQQLEDIVVSIAKKELKMITVLGGVLGGIIGVVQGILVLLIN